MKKIFEAMMKDKNVLREIIGHPMEESVFFALYDFVAKGNDLSTIPWFAATKYARKRNEKLATKKIAA